MSNTNAVGRRVKRIAAVLLILFAGYLAVSFLYKLPEISSRTQSQAIETGADTFLGRQFAAPNRKVTGRIECQGHAISRNSSDGQRNSVADYNALSDLPG